MLNKIDLINDKQKENILKVIKRINPKATIYETTQSKIDLKKILDTNSFSFSEARHMPGWLQVARGSMKSELEEYNFKSFTFKSDRPFHPDRLRNLVARRLLRNVIRAKGFVWIADRYDVIFIWQQACYKVDFLYGGKWFHAMQK